MDTAALAVKWPDLLPAEPNAEWRDDSWLVATAADARRKLADYDTGSITEYEAYLLRAVAEYFKATVVIEVGTFIGTSTCTLALASEVEAVYTCDISNDCLPSHGIIATFPKVSSTDMLLNLIHRGIKADFCFFDGVLSDEDVDLLAESTTPDVVFAMHDYNYGPKIRKWGLETVPRKGIGNVRLLKRLWPQHVVLDPLPDTTLALMVTESRL